MCGETAQVCAVLHGGVCKDYVLQVTETGVALALAGLFPVDLVGKKKMGGMRVKFASQVCNEDSERRGVGPPAVDVREENAGS
mmetsp:Transcript_5278/g.7772  ORF Transcript_5278/g.7772 Transcript_5278/m.7772 type:complete len:83 (-) Transcript_5278:153-401(-)